MSSQTTADMESVLSMSDLLVNHTWSIRTTSPFAVPFDIQETNIESNMSKFFRSQRAARSSEAGNNTEADDEKGTYISLHWGHLGLAEEEQKTSRRTSDRKFKDRKSSDTDVDNLQEETTLHLIIDAIVQDEHSAQLILCYLHSSEESLGSAGQHIIENVDFCLARGSKGSLDAIFSWMETFTGCVVAKTPFTPTTAELAQAMTLWTTENWQKVKARNIAISNPKQSEEDTMSEIARPLTLTFNVPPDLANSGLDSVSLNIPPVSLLTLCSDMLVARQRLNTQELVEPLPILQALQSFILETFRINVKPFSLVRASCPVAIFGCDGRCKPLCSAFMENILQEIQSIVMMRSTVKKLDIPSLDEVSEE